MKKALILLHLILIGYLPAHSQTNLEKFESLNLEEGFPSAVVYSFLRDSRGFMWFGSGEGLILYDGVIHKVYYPNKHDSTQLYDANINHLFEDSKGRIWLSANIAELAKTIQVFNPSTERFIRFNFRPILKIDPNSFLEDEAGNIWIKTFGSGLYKIEEEMPNQFSVTNFKVSSAHPKEVAGDSIGVLFIDSREKFWIGTQNGLYTFDRATNKFDKFPDNDHGENDLVTGIVEDQKGNLWVNYAWKGLMMIEGGSGDLIEKWPEPNPTPWNRNLRYMLLDNSNNIWMIKQRDGTFNFSSLDQYNIKTGEISRHFNADQYKVPIYRLTPQVDQEGNMWVLFDDGIYIYNPDTGSFKLFIEFTGRGIHFYHDRYQNIWVTHYGHGVLKINPSNQKVKILSSEPIQINTPNSFIEDSNGNIFIANEKGLIKYTLNTAQEVIEEELILKDKVCNYLLKDKSGNLWASCLNQEKWEYIYINPASNKILYSFHITPKFGDARPTSIVEISDKELMIATQVDGIYHHHKATSVTTRFSNDPDDSTSLSQNYWNMFFIDDQKIWVYNREGIALFNKDRKNFIHFDHGKAESLENIWYVHENNHGKFWISATNGLYLYEPSTGTIHKSYLAKDGFPTLAIYKIISDNEGNLWLGTNTGLVRFNVEEEQFKVFDKTDGLPSNRVYTGCRRKNGEFVFGGDKGLFIFHPDKIPLNQNPPNPAFTEFRLFNQNVDIDGKVLSKTISYTDEIVLNHDQNVISFTYSALSFANPAKNQYAYFMEGIDKDWNYVGNQTFASYAGLTPGEYTLNLKASNNDGLWNETPTTLAITILAPWWQTWWAYLIYAVLFMGTLFTFYHFQLNRKLEKAETQRLHELDTFKSRFYTNITHEFRTPLTVILGVTDEMDQQYQKVKSVIKRNGLNLLQLVNQMLDLSKLEAGMLTVNLQQGDIIPYIRYIAESFHSLAEHKDIHTHFRSEIPELVMDYDADKILNILSNLLSNAIKFTPEGGHVSLVVSQIQENHTSKFHLRIMDTGIGIPADQLPHIFDRFYQVDASTTRKGEGTGIGLSLTQELIKLLGGSIEVKSTIGQGTEFTVKLPVTNIAPMAGEMEQPAFEIAGGYEDDFIDGFPDNGERRGQPLALIVEDNVDVVYYLKSCLQDKYTLEVSHNGQEGIEKALATMPDIIISDIMMPEKNGYELCSTLKNHEKTSHIPIILLTAKAAEEDKLEGLEVGADAYLTKPFNKEELKLRIKNLIAHRKKLWRQYNESLPYNPQELEVSSHDRQFLTKALEVLEDYKSDPDFNAEKLQKELGVSRTLLHVKLKALTGQSTSEFIRTYRLKYAAQLIQQNFGNIAQVAYEAGFNDQSYFTKTFKKHFGEAPSEYAKSASV